MNDNRFRLFVCCVGLAFVLPGCAYPLGNSGGAPGAGADVLSGVSKAWGSLVGTNGDRKIALPENPSAVARLCERRGQTEQAERIYQEIIRRSPKNPFPYHRLAVISAQQGKPAEAEKYFSSAMALKPDDPELLCDLGYFYYLSGRLQEAERYMRQAVEIEPNDARYCNNLALVVGGQGRDDESVAFFSRTNSPNDALLNHAFVLAQRRDYQRAMDAYDRALTQDRSSRVAADALIELSKYAPQAGVSGSSSVLAAQGAFPHADQRVGSPSPPVADEHTRGRVASTSTSSKLPPSTFSSSALAAAPKSTPEPLTQSSAQPRWPVPYSYPSTGFSEAVALRREIVPPPGRTARFPAAAASYGVPPVVGSMARLPDTSTHDSTPAHR